MPFSAAAKPLVAVVVSALCFGCSAVDGGPPDEVALRSEALVSGDPLDQTPEGAPTDDPSGQATGGGGDDVTDDPADDPSGEARVDVEPAPGSSDPDPELSPDPDVVYPADTCYRQPIPGQRADEVACDQPHSIEVYASVDLPGGPDAPYQGLDAALAACDAEFRPIAGIGLNLATVFDRSVLRPSEETWADGERDVTCYVVYPQLVSEPLAAIDPVRSFGRVSMFGLAVGDCLVDFDETVSWFEAVPCDQPHEAEVFIAERLVDTAFPGEAELDARSDGLCFGPPFEEFIGRDYASSSVYSVVLVPTAETWEQGDRTINCVLTDDLVRSQSLRGSEL